MKLTGYETYCMYLALKNHFTKDNYDFFKNNGKVHVSKESYLNRRDRIQFEKIARRHDDPKGFMVAGFLSDRTWIGELLDDDAENSYQQYVKNNQSRSYIFKNELEKADDLKSLFKPEDNGYPKFLNDYMRGDISFDTIVILDHFIQFIPKFDAKLKDDYLWSKFSFKARKYKPFLLQDLDQKKFKELLTSRINATI